MRARGLACGMIMAVIGLALTVGGCKRGPEASVEEIRAKETAAREVALSWLALMDAGKYGETYDTAAEFFKKSTTREAWITMVQGPQTSLGKVLSRELKATQYARQLPGAPDGEYVMIQFKTSFENKKAAAETITPMLDPDGQWRVSGYFIQ
jgi:hypothetical protein